MYLNQIKSVADSGVEMQLGNPVTGEPFELVFDKDGNCTGQVDKKKPITTYLKLLGTDSKAFQARVREYVKSKATAATDADDNSRLEDALTMLVGWRGLSLNGKTDLEYTPENARKVLTEHDWIIDQINTFTANRKNFIKSNAKN